MTGIARGARMFGWAAVFAVGVVVGFAVAPRAPLPKAHALTALADDAFAVCTVPIGPGIEGFFMLDFETGDLSGGILNPATSRFSGSYKHNVLKDLGFKAGQAKNPRFLLVSGVADVQAGGNNQFAQSVLYVTDSSTGTTVAYGIPWNPQANAAAAFASELVPLDVARPRGGGAKAAGAAKGK